MFIGEALGVNFVSRQERRHKTVSHCHPSWPIAAIGLAYQGELCYTDWHMTMTLVTLWGPIASGFSFSLRLLTHPLFTFRLSCTTVTPSPHPIFPSDCRQWRNWDFVSGEVKKRRRECVWCLCRSELHTCTDNTHTHTKQSPVSLREHTHIQQHSSGVHVCVCVG